ncbi:uncharacterized protein AMSG_08516 [Thecamonas trahens ATCC 50062]|uniref:WGR domain-containing protein n=1 Tax=Thecamonas trahens ATCC 50062 TaxID=461836 RepID=A0A0L0DK42_THETB|nr:hypothetical protein AMSG_08516 [Thecamonas trahens ATCC 50062]KNC52647.1 hypothetical protein AMSG_08516 [Thecamonas trahens ATCC 50062]|eukprot:XP_013755198.1 hypothetical protein AMSG_08516 [Thecamonas trahens ATCC 50062]
MPPSPPQTREALLEGRTVALESLPGPSSWFWTVALDGEEVVTRSGEVGAAGDESITDFPSTQDALATAVSLLDAKIANGFRVLDAREVLAQVTGGDIEPTARGASPEDIASLNAKIFPRKLPSLYAAMLQVADGAVLDLTAIHAVGLDAPIISQLGSVSELGDSDLYANEWDFPFELCGRTLNIDGDGHAWVILDYVHPGPSGEPSVAHVLQWSDPPYTPVKIADSFADFMLALRKADAGG